MQGASSHILSGSRSSKGSMRPQRDGARTTAFLFLAAMPKRPIPPRCRLLLFLNSAVAAARLLANGATTAILNRAPM